MWCVHCGAKLKDGDRFCMSCGAPQPGATFPSAPATPAAGPSATAAPYPAQVSPARPSSRHGLAPAAIAAIVVGSLVAALAIAYGVTTAVYGARYDAAYGDALAANRTLSRTMTAAEKVLDAADDGDDVSAATADAIDRLKDSYDDAADDAGLPAEPNRLFLWQLVPAVTTMRQDADQAQQVAVALDDATSTARKARRQDVQRQKAQRKETQRQDDESESGPSRSKTVTPHTATTYRNSRFAYQLLVPAGFTWEPERAGGAGRTFVNRSLDMTIAASGRRNTLGDTAQSLLTAESAGHDVAYKALPGDGMVVSYEENGRVYYIRSIVTPKYVRTVRFDYPSANRDKGAAIVEQVYPTIKATDD